jgi:hypothetical protein
VSEALARLERRGPGFLPVPWRPRAEGPGAAYLDLLAHFSSLVEASLVAAPDKHSLAFLDAMGVTLLAPTPARAPLVFTLADDAPIDVPLPAATEVAAVEAPPLPGSLAGGEAVPAQQPEPVVFTTDQAVSLGRASLAAVFSVVPASDEYADHTARLRTGFALFDDLEQIPHHLYFAHDRLFELPSAATVSLQVGVAGRGAVGPALRWEYATQEGWLGFEPVVDQSHGLTVDGEVVLQKLCGPPSVKTTVAGIASYWLRARVVDALPLPGTGGAASTLPRVDRLRARVSFGERNVPLDAAFAGGLRLDTTKDFAPFGPQPQIGSVFAVACDKAFDRERARIELRFDDSRANKAAVASRTLAWEYSTGEGVWQELPGIAEQFVNGAGERGVVFVRPDDWAQVALSGERHRWLRVRLVAGDYGPSGNPPTFAPPVLAWMTVTYEVQSGPHELDHCRSLNRFDYLDHTEACRWGRDPFQPFRPVPDRVPAVYLGFDRPLPVGLVSLFASVAPEVEAAAPPGTSSFAWEYAAEDDWEELPLLDETAGLRGTGTIQFVGPVDLAARAGPDAPLFWVRARLKTGAASPDAQPLTGLYLNGVWATHRRSVTGEVLGQSDGSARLTLSLRHAPVLPGPHERIEVEEWSGTGREWESLFRDVAEDDLRYERDARDRVVGVWVTWHERPHLHSSRPRDRDYTLERASGLLRFGDGTAGMIPPPGAAVAARYEYVERPSANAAAGAISQLHSAVPYVAAVTNPLPAAGGAPGETPARVPARGRQQLRHRHRAVAASDYAWIARDATAEVALARCLPTTGPGGEAPGSVTVLVAPASAEPQPRPSPELLRRVRAYLAARAPAAVAADVRVLGAEYQPVSVVAGVLVSDPEAAAAVEERLRTSIDAFLHPLTGGPPGGWTFGDVVYLSHVARVVETVEGVDCAEEIQLTSEGAVFGDRVPISADRLPAAGRHLLKLRVEA